MSHFPRNPLPEEHAKTTADALQPVVAHLIDLALASKQIHWNLVGRQFLSVHEKLDEVTKTARKGSDTIAERMAQLGFSPDGRSKTLCGSAELSDTLPGDFIKVGDGLTQICDRLKKVNDVIAKARQITEESDPYVEDELIAINQQIDEQLWMFQAMEEGA